MSKIEINGTVLAYDDTGGDGRPVVLLHAGIADRRMWRPILDRLGDRYRLIALDLRGYGESELPPESFAHHDDVAALIDALGVGPAAVVGCSFGGAVAIDTALSHPDRVAALALFDSAIKGHEWSDETNEIWDSLIGGIDANDLDAVAEAELRFWVVGPGRQPDQVDPELMEFAREMERRALVAEQALSAVDAAELDPPAIQRLGELKIPVLVGAGAADVPEISQLADRIAATVPGAVRLPDVPDAAHLLPLERPEPVATALTSFLG